MRAPLAEATRRLRESLLPLALLASAPKCALCLLAYAGLGSALGLAGPELCGATAGPPSLALPLLYLTGLAAWQLHRATRARSCAGRGSAVLCPSDPLCPRR